MGNRSDADSKQCNLERQSPESREARKARRIVRDINFVQGTRTAT